MGMLDFLKGGKKPPAPRRARSSRSSPSSTQFQGSQNSQQGSSPHSVRKDLLKLVLRECLSRNGIPQQWLSADLLRTTNAQREHGMHVRFLVRHWEPRLLLHGVAFEREFLERLLLLDPLARDWIAGFSWQFAMADSTACPPLPHPGAWTAPPPSEPVVQAAPETRPGDIIEGPVVIPQPVDDVRADLERLLALRDEDLKRHGHGADQFAPTRPATL